MNVIELHDKVLGLLDQVRSGRIHPEMLDVALNIAHITILNQKKGIEGLSAPVSYYPEESNRLKDSLKYYYEDRIFTDVDLSFDVDSNFSTIIVSELLSVQINKGSHGVPSWITPTPIDKKDETEIAGNTFIKPRNGGWLTSYFSYAGGLIEFFLPAGLSISEKRIGILRHPGEVNSGLTVHQTDFTQDGKTVIVTSPKAIINGTIRLRSEVVVIATSNLLTSGDVCYDYLTVDIDPTIIDTVSQMAAQIISSGRFGNLSIAEDRNRN